VFPNLGIGGRRLDVAAPGTKSKGVVPSVIDGRGRLRLLGFLLACRHGIGLVECRCGGRKGRHGDDGYNNGDIPFLESIYLYTVLF
jgi:hypothetical protein